MHTVPGKQPSHFGGVAQDLAHDLAGVLPEQGLLQQFPPTLRTRTCNRDFSDLHGFDQNLSEGERGSQQLVVAFDHAPPQCRDPLRALAPVLDEVHEEVRIPEDSAHPHPSRSRST